MRFRDIASFTLLLVALFAALCRAPAIAAPAIERIDIDAHAASRPFPHFWEQMFGSGRAALSLRESYRDDLRQVKRITDFRYVRFHAIFHDELGVYDEDAQGHPVYNFSYIDQIYDGLLANGVRPFVELGFMPHKLAAHPEGNYGFWYRVINSPPKDMAKWDAFITAFARHLVDRYGIDEVSKWYFEVWNEPNLGFWKGNPPQRSYFELYDHTARALKAVNPRLRVGGPATAQAAWVDLMIDHALKHHVPLDFVSTHAYGDDSAQNVFGDDRPIPPHQMVCAAVKKVHDQIKASARPNIPLIWSEFNATFMTQPKITDSVYMGPWLANMVSHCDGMTDMMSYWTFSDVFEEQGVVKQPFYGGYGLIAERGIPKPAFNAYALLHQLGDKRLAVPGDDVLATRRDDGTLAVAAWNLVEPGAPGATGATKAMQLAFRGVSGDTATIRRVDAQHGNPLAAWIRMGRPPYPTRAQIAELKRAADPGPPQTVRLERGSDGVATLTLNLPRDGLALVEVR